ncbi:Lyso-phosphatidylcholine acyltransferase [Malassezia vespertilionis]|uniref:Lyso-phosphatidylcholine acyltransferase n=1 Tax=Malassezia vespertilionis TaxID=2020962 RepID=UPI0024B0F292|nr:Lyso-phosphatidylcholine acyltransferase [Malassezia vespertilionis]WFD07151.1 Lyso-phosphatidylcholine acyltransferase [Malassezia vespertilionis]
MLERQVIEVVGALSKAFLTLGCRSVRVHGTENLLRVLNDTDRINAGRGVLTCTLDEPLMWGAMPMYTYSSAHTTRWSLGASDIIFTNSFFSWFFRKGQTLEVFRGQGIFQSALDNAVLELERGHWVHIFPEGLVNLSSSTALKPFKWGVSRLFLEPLEAPVVVPIWLTGFDQIMPNNRAHPRWMPRRNADVSVTFGEPLREEITATYHNAFHELCRDASVAPYDAQWPPRLASGIVPNEVFPTRGPPKLAPQDSEAYATLRSYFAAVLRRELHSLGCQVRARHGLPPGEGILSHGHERGEKNSHV